jgi:hypothetical protein
METTWSFAQVKTAFQRDILVHVIEKYESDGIRDIPARREAWNDFLDGLARDEQITEQQADEWCLPDELEYGWGFLAQASIPIH